VVEAFPSDRTDQPFTHPFCHKERDNVGCYQQLMLPIIATVFFKADRMQLPAALLEMFGRRRSRRRE
jgi:hypothetical protein